MFLKLHLFKYEDRIIPEPNSGCWLWTGTLSDNGYARAKINKKYFRVHRLFFEEYIGKIPDGLILDHLCRVRCCVNPHHLEPVTNAENVRRGDTGKFRSKWTRCINGHPYTDENTARRKNKNRTRRCMECERIYAQRARDRKKAIAIQDFY